MSIEEKLCAVQERIAAACERAGRNPDDVTLVVVTKTVTVDVIRRLIELGVADIGENRVNDMLAKADDLGSAPGVRFHMIGHVQRRKARKVVGAFDMIHSVDSLPLARRLSDVAAEQGTEMPVLMEINVSGEESKFGFAPAAALEAAPMIAALPSVRLDGLMTMAPLGAEEAELRSVFRGLRELSADISSQHHINMPHLSMGMSQDYELAIEEGATIVRVGTAIVG